MGCEVSLRTEPQGSAFSAFPSSTHHQGAVLDSTFVSLLLHTFCARCGRAGISGAGSTLALVVQPPECPHVFAGELILWENTQAQINNSICATGRLHNHGAQTVSQRPCSGLCGSPSTGHIISQVLAGLSASGVTPCARAASCFAATRRVWDRARTSLLCLKARPKIWYAPSTQGAPRSGGTAANR
jgi:hypothetical protein